MQLMEIKGLHKRFSGRPALQGVDMTLQAGKITGLLGPNGSGKTTLMKAVACLLQPDAGEITYPGGAQRGTASRATVSFLPDSSGFPGWMRVQDAFDYHRKVFADFDGKRASELIQILELDRHAQIKRLSKGMRERVALGLVFSRNAPIYLLDEPLGGIDPIGKMIVLESILSMPLENAAILLSTHLVKDVETIFDDIYLLSEGAVIFSGECEKIREESGKTVEQIYLEVFSGGYSA